MIYGLCLFIFFFFNDTATTEIYTLSLHDALPIFARNGMRHRPARLPDGQRAHELDLVRSEEHTSELQSRQYLVCRLLLEKKKKNNSTIVKTKGIIMIKILRITLHLSINYCSNIKL